MGLLQASATQGACPTRIVPAFALFHQVPLISIPLLRIRRPSTLTLTTTNNYNNNNSATLILPHSASSTIPPTPSPIYWTSSVSGTPRSTPISAGATSTSTGLVWAWTPLARSSSNRALLISTSL